MSIVYLTASTLNGFLADEFDSLDWLFAVEGEAPDLDSFMARASVLVMGSTTYTWVLDHGDIVTDPQKWQQFHGDRPTFVFSTRDLPVPTGADVRVVRGDVADVLPEIREVAGEGTVWVMGGGDLVGQFLDVDALDEVVVQFAPALVSSGRPLLPRTVGPDRLHLVDVRQVGQFAELRYAVSHPSVAGGTGPQ